jgi:hypothetical protein
MYHVVDTDRLRAEGVLSAEQVAVIRRRAREAMMRLAVDALLTGGIVAATFGLIFWLGEPLPVALVGAATLAAGMAALGRGGEAWRFFGLAAALIGAGMLLGGAGFELSAAFGERSGPPMLAAGLVVAAAFGIPLLRASGGLRFACGAICLMGLAMHLTGLGLTAAWRDWAGLPMAAVSLYAAAALALAGAATDVRLVTALAVVPYAQTLSTGTSYWHAAYVFYSPEATLSILQMAVLVAGGLWAARALPERWGRHGGILAIMAAVVANLCALVGSLWGDWVGQTVWGPGGSWWRNRDLHADPEAFARAEAAFHETALYIGPGVYSVAWALALAAAAVWAARGARRGLFNVALTFAAIHAYTQAFESFHDQPLAYVIGGLAAIPLAWGLWQLDRRFWAARAG